MEQAVLVHIPSDDPTFDYDSFGLDLIEDPLIEAIEVADAGEFDGNEIAIGGEAVLYMYGPDADRLFEAIEPVLRPVSLPKGTFAIKRYGEPGAREERIEIG